MLLPGLRFCLWDDNELMTAPGPGLASLPTSYGLSRLHPSQWSLGEAT